MIQRIGIGFALALAVVGLSASAVLLQHHVAIATGSDPILAAVCESAETASCDEVLSSDWARLLGQPTALWGFCYFAALFAWYFLVGVAEGRARALNLLPLFATLAGTAACAALAFIMYFKLPKWCPLCAVTHVATWVLLLINIVLWRGAKRVDERMASGEQAPARISSAHSLGLLARQVIGVLVLASALSFAAWANYHRRVQTSIAQAYQKQRAEREQLLAQLGQMEQQSEEFRERWEEYHREYAAVYRSFLEQRVVDLPLSPGVPFRGNAAAPNTVVVFSDVLCPYCAGAERLLKEQLEQFPTELRVAWKHFPMDKDCNPKLNSTLHPGACEASWAVEAARILGGDEAYWTMLDTLMDHRREFRTSAQQIVNEAADKTGLDRQALWKTIRGPESRERVDRNIAEGQALGLRSTPSVYLNGRPVRQFADKHFWRFALRDAKNLDMTTQPAQTQPVTLPAPDDGPADAEPARTTVFSQEDTHG